MREIGYKIKKLREEKNISQFELAEDLNISQSKLSKMESGKCQVSIQLLIALFQYFELSVNELIDFLQFFT